MKNAIPYLFLIFVLVAACNQAEKKDMDKKVDKKLVKKHLERANKYLVKAEEQNIRDFIKRYDYQMKETGSGLFYEIYKQSRGEQASEGKTAQLNFQIFLLTGELIYSSDKEGIKEFLIGKGGVESGLEEGILLMKTGERARFIIPSHLAFGLLGDLNRIPEKATIVYDVELIGFVNKSKKQE